MTKRTNPTPALFKWLTPGIQVKRWIVLLMGGAFLLGLGLAVLALDLYRRLPPLEAELTYTVLSLGDAPVWLRVVLAFIGGTALIAIALVQMNRSILAPYASDDESVIEQLVAYRLHTPEASDDGPLMVAIGGGTGLPTLLRGLKHYTNRLSAIITVADDGGSSGRLREDMGVLPPGDFRNNIAALANDEALITQLFQYRFGNGGLSGHSFGNLLITALAEITGSFEEALLESSRVLAVSGRVLPSTLADLQLVADVRLPDNQVERVVGESLIPKTGGTIERLSLDPAQARAYPEAVKAILAAELIVLGPGSLYTSILPNVLVQDIADALRASKALKVYVCNVATQKGETDGFSVADHVRVFDQHVGAGVFDVVLINDEFPPLPENANYHYVRHSSTNGTILGVRVHSAPLIDPRRPWRHDSERLTRAVVDLLASSGLTEFAPSIEGHSTHSV
ncbi:MAG: YvcK family protein [Chloroflexi bacterium]|nr:YvcK family protein [Chloroflexota bacterium]